MSIVTTRYTLLGQPGSRQETFQSFELARDTQTGATTLVALDIFSLDRTHYDASNAGVSVQGMSVFVGGLANGVEFAAPRATYDFVLDFDLNDPTRATIDRTAIRLDVGTVTTDTPSIDASYYDLLGRLPNGSELDYWNSTFSDGRADTSALRHTIVSDPNSGATVRSTIDKLYVAFGGRGASTTEFAFWGARLADGEHYSGVQAAIIDDPLGRQHIGDVTDALYREYGGRAVSAGETAFWINEVRRGTTYDGIRNAILDDPLGEANTAGRLGALYQEYFGRAPSANEVAVWDGQFHRGTGYGVVASTLMLDPGSTGIVRQFQGTYMPDSIDLGTQVGHVVINDFDPRANRIRLSGTVYAGIDPLDGTHARDVQAFGSTFNVLIALGDHDTILLQGLSLFQLQGGGYFF